MFIFGIFLFWEFFFSGGCIFIFREIGWGIWGFVGIRVDFILVILYEVGYGVVYEVVLGTTFFLDTGRRRRCGRVSEFWVGVGVWGGGRGGSAGGEGRLCRVRVSVMGGEG